MPVGLDSATPPNAAQVAAAKAAGIAVWSGYLATRGGVKLARPWTEAEFAVVKALPGVPIAFYSGWDDPAKVKALAAAWGVLPCLDVESGIRGDGPWVDGNLAVVGGGLYGGQYVHSNRKAAFHIASLYPTPMVDPKATWPAGWTRPGAACGWQWWNTHNEFGVGVDRSNLDDWFGGIDMLPGQFFDTCVRSWFLALFGRPVNEEIVPPVAVSEFTNWRAQFAADGSNMGAVWLDLFREPEAVAYRAKGQGPQAPQAPAPFKALITPE